MNKHSTRFSRPALARSLAKLSVAIAFTLAAGCSSEPAPIPEPVRNVAETTVAPIAATSTSAPVASATPSASATATPTPSVVADPVPAPHKPQLDLDAPLAVERLIVAEGVKAREPVGAATSFASDAKRIYAFVEMKNPERAESQVFVSFVPPSGVESGAIELRVGPSPRWRTWAYTRLAKTPGTWTVKVHDAHGKQLAKATFEIAATAVPSA